MKRILVLSALALGGVAQAQAPNIPASALRSGQPEVLTAPAPAPSDQPRLDRRQFAAAYARAGRPAIALLWNREFTDMLQQTSASQLSIDTVRAGASSAEAVRLPGYAAAQAQGASVANTTITLQDTKTVQGQRSGPVERVDLQLRSAFVQTLVSAGVKLVDRNVVMRTTAAKTAGALDTQQVEAAAIAKHAQLLMEVLNTRDAASPTGWATYVTVKRLSDGTVLAEGYMNGKPAEDAPKPTPKFEADPRGGFREVVKPTAVGDVGKLIGEQSLARLGEALAR
ncbi:MAG TPA: hypothetical protein VLJ86_27320 [Ramlibacter sp.]|nr:hypothetical protein [Ramlibacter sp.]